MASTPLTFLAQSVQTTVASTFKITIAGTPHTCTLPALWYRVYLASTAGAGSGHTAPKELLDAVQDAIDAGVGSAGASVRMRSDGRVEMTHSGGTWSMLWDGTSSTDKVARDMLGWASNIASIASGVYATADYHAVGVMTAFARLGDKGWQPEATMESVRTEGGVIIAQKSGYMMASRAFDFGFLPTDKAARSSLGYTVPVAMPDEDDGTRFQRPSTACVGSMAGPWSAWEFLYTAPGVECAAALGTFQDHISGATTRYTKVYVDNTFAKQGAYELIQEGYSQQRHVRGVVLAWNASAVRS